MEIPGIEYYYSDEGKLAALVIYENYSPDGISFPTPNNISQQLGAMRRPAGYVVEAHTHTPQNRRIEDTVEVLFVRSGLLEICLYNTEHEPFATFTVGPLAAVLLAAGGHGVTFLEDSDVLEVKQGPYTESVDKLRFVPRPPTEKSS